MIKIDWNPARAQLRSFGFIAFFGFALMATLGLWRFTDWTMHPVIWSLFGLAILCPLLALLCPTANKPIYVGMLLLTAPIGFVVSAVVLRLIYYGLFTPLAVVFRWKGRDVLLRKRDPDATSYWLDHRDQNKARSAASYLRLY